MPLLLCYQKTYHSAFEHSYSLHLADYEDVAILAVLVVYDLPLADSADVAGSAASVALVRFLADVADSGVLAALVDVADFAVLAVVLLRYLAVPVGFVALAVVHHFLADVVDLAVFLHHFLADVVDLDLAVVLPHSQVAPLYVADLDLA